MYVYTLHMLLLAQGSPRSPQLHANHLSIPCFSVWTKLGKQQDHAPVQYKDIYPSLAQGSPRSPQLHANHLRIPCSSVWTKLGNKCYLFHYICMYLFNTKIRGGTYNPKTMVVVLPTRLQHQSTMEPHPADNHPRREDATTKLGAR